VREFRREAHRYVAVQRAHVVHENERLLPLADQLLTPADDEAVVQGFAGLERAGSVAVKEVVGRIRALCARLGVAPE
jgi:hypothetical protein